MPRRLPLALVALALAAPLATPSPARAAPAADDEEARKKAAAAAVKRGQKAFERGKYAKAIVAFEEANALRPAAKLEFNLGICHQRLVEAAIARGDRQAEAEHASAAIDALNRYLAARPAADDRPMVEDLIRSLGGRPITQASLKPAPTGPVPGAPSGEAAGGDATDAAPPSEGGDEGAPADEGGEDEGDEGDEDAPSEAVPENSVPDPDEPAAVPLTPAPAPLVPRAALGAAIGVFLLPQLAGNPAVEGESMGGLIARGGAFLGARRRLYVGGDLGLAAGGNKVPTKLALTAQGLDLVVGLRLPLARGRLELPLSLALGGAREAVRSRAEAPRPACAVGDGTLVGRRFGGRVGGRAGLLVLLGARRAHGLGFGLGAHYTGYGPGPSTAGCSQAVFADLGLGRHRLTIAIDIGYTFRL